MSIDEYFNHEIHNEWLRDSSPDRKYTIVLNEVGHSFLFGASKANITLFNSMIELHISMYLLKMMVIH